MPHRTAGCGKSSLRPLMAGSSPSLPDGSNPSAAIVQSASDVQCSRLLKTTEFEHNLIRDRTVAGLAAARARGRMGGRRPKLSKVEVRKAADMLKDPTMTKTEVAAHFGISRVTLNAALERAGYPQNPAAA